MDKRQVTLPDSLINAIRLVCADPATEPGAALEAALLITYGYAMYERTEAIDPTKIVVPNAQWLQIAQWLTDIRGPSINRVNLGLSWMNIGPSGYDPQDTQVPA
jgi:hypothetical protein